ncbi:MAG: DUF2804 domain-containing protein [Spirochaetaceae bacterium]|jgi:hypothetical protein|nr:DUF2804 domain-containing protein [Spirochaetaceae bacterium]
MYKRRLLPQRDSPVEDGKPLQGTWTTPFETVNLLSVKRPYRVPLPNWVLDLRIKEWQTFTAQNDDIWLEAVIANLKLFCFAEITFLDKKKNEKMHVAKALPPAAWKMPQSLRDGVVEHDSAGFSFKIHDFLASRKITLDIDIDSAIERPVFAANLEFDLDIQKTTPLAANLLIAENRPMYIFKGFSDVEGTVIWGDRNMPLNREATGGLFHDVKGFIPYRSRYFSCRSLGVDTKGRRFAFSLGEHITRKLNVNNESALWLEGTLTALPPVRIVMYEHGEAVIQDLEGMVDLTFKLAEDTVARFDMFFVGMEHRNQMGHFNGTLTTADGEKLPVRNLPGAAECFDFRL